MKAYVVTADTCEDGYGVVVNLLKVADNEEDAKNRMEDARAKGWSPTLTVVDMNESVEHCLGWYVE